MKKIKCFNFTTNNTNRHKQQNNNITKVRGGFLVRGLFSLLCATAVLFTGCFDFDERPDSGGGEFVPVESIHDIPTHGLPNAVIPLSGIVMPENATYKKIAWSIKNNGAQASLDGNRLTANAEGTVTVTARIANGLGEGEDFTHDFHILVSLAPNTSAVRSISGIPWELTFGSYTLEGIVIPSNAVSTTITWEVVHAGTTGATVTPAGFLTTTANGTVIIRGTVEGGLLEDGDYTQDFSIMITKPVFAAGYYSPGPSGDLNNSIACYWIDGTWHDDLEHPPATGNYSYSYAYGIAYSGGKLYVSGFYGNIRGNGTNHTGIYYRGTHPFDVNYTPCYWVDGERVELPKPGTETTGRTGYTQTNGGGARTFSIAVVGEKVYITGAAIVRNEIANSTQNYSDWCYGTRYLWIHDRSSDSPPQMIPLTAPAGGYTFPNGNIVEELFEGRFAVSSSGNVYIPMGVIPPSLLGQKGFYWDENGDAHQINVGAEPFSYQAHSAAIINGQVYFAGYRDMIGSTVIPSQLFYTVLGSNSHTLLNGTAVSSGCVNSIVNQNGSPVFYGFLQRGDDYSYYWNASGGRSDLLPDTYYFPETRSVVFSDGDVYVIMKRTMPRTDIYSDNFGYTAVGGQMRVLLDTHRQPVQKTVAAVTAIAVP